MPGAEAAWKTGMLIRLIRLLQPRRRREFLPERAQQKGRATEGSAQTLLAKVYMQQRRWTDASALFTQLISSGQYAPVPSYLDNFTDANENNRESVFEVQFTNSVLEAGQGQDNGSASEAYDRPTFFGPPYYTFSDVQPRQWLLNAHTDSTPTFVSGSGVHAKSAALFK